MQKLKNLSLLLACLFILLASPTVRAEPPVHLSPADILNELLGATVGSSASQSSIRSLENCYTDHEKCWDAHRLNKENVEQVLDVCWKETKKCPKVCRDQYFSYRKAGMKAPKADDKVLSGKPSCIPGLERPAHLSEKEKKTVTIPRIQITTTDKLTASNIEEKQTQTAIVIVKAGSAITKSLNFDKLRTGNLKLNMLMAGRPIPFEIGWTSPARGFLSDEYLFSSETGEPVVPLSSAYVQPMKLRVGIYDLKVHERTISGKDIVIKKIAIREGATVEKTVDIRQPGALHIMARWTHQPLNIVACAKYHNPINLNRLGALMGGGSGSGGRSRGDCLDPEVRLGASISSPGRSGGDIAKTVYTKRIANKNGNGKIAVGENIEVLGIAAGFYDISLWPVGHQELEQTLKGVEITAGGIVQEKLEFRWPGKKK